VRPSTSSAVAAICALSGFTVAVLAGLFAGVPADRVLVRALCAMVACYPVGLLVAGVAQRVLNDHLARGQGAESALLAGDGGRAESGEGKFKSDDGDEEVLVV